MPSGKRCLSSMYLTRWWTPSNADFAWAPCTERALACKHPTIVAREFPSHLASRYLQTRSTLLIGT